MALAGGFLFTGGAFAANASDQWAGYSTTVGRMNGSGYTDTQKKGIAGAAGELQSEWVGADYRVDARLQDGAGGQSGSWSRDVQDGSVAALYNSIPAGTATRVQFSNDWNTTVNVQVTGIWRAL